MTQSVLKCIFSYASVNSYQVSKLMINIPIWALMSINVLAVASFIFFQKRNALLLSTEEKKERSEIISEENRIKRWQNWSFLAGSVILVMLNLFFEANLPVNSIFYLIIIQQTFLAFRNRKIYQRINLPEEYINREFYLSLGAVLLIVVNIFAIF